MIHPKFLAVSLLLVLGSAPVFASALPTTLNATVNLSFTKTFWSGQYYMSNLNVRATNSEQQTDVSQPTLVKGSTATVRLSNKSVLNGVKGKLVAVWDGPGNVADYPYLASWEKGKAPVKLNGWSISALFVEDPADTRSTINGALRIKQSQNVLVPATDNPNVPKNEQKVSGYTRFTFGIKDSTPSDAIQGWGPFVGDFKKLFSGKAKLTGSVDQ